MTLGPQETLLIWNVSLSAPVGWIEVSGSRNIPRSIVIGENSDKSSVWKKAMLAGREDANTLVGPWNELSEDQNKQPTSNDSTLNKQWTEILIDDKFEDSISGEIWDTTKGFFYVLKRRYVQLTTFGITFLDYLCHT